MNEINGPAKRAAVYHRPICLNNERGSLLSLQAVCATMRAD